MGILTTISERAAKMDLPFLLAGGHAVIAHGHPRNTFDIDLIIRRDDREKWTALAHDLGYNFHSDGPTFVQFNAANQNDLPLDLMLVSRETFEQLEKDAIPGPVHAPGAKIVSLLHLLALKCHALKHGREGRIVKDTDDVIRLTQANRLDVNEPGIRELFLKYGTVEFYEKIQRICSSE